MNVITKGPDAPRIGTCQCDLRIRVKSTFPGAKNGWPARAFHRRSQGAPYDKTATMPLESFGNPWALMEINAQKMKQLSLSFSSCLSFQNDSHPTSVFRRSCPDMSSSVPSSSCPTAFHLHNLRKGLKVLHLFPEIWMSKSGAQVHWAVILSN